MKKFLMMAIICGIFASVCILIGIWICAFRSPSVDEIAVFIGKTEDELRSQVGSPERVRFIETALPPKEYQGTKWDAWIEWQCDHELVYGNTRVEVNAYNKIIRVYSGSLRPPTVEEIARYCGKKEIELYQVFGLPQDIKFLENSLPEDTSDVEIEEIQEQTTARELTYGKAVVCIDMNDRITMVSCCEH